MLNNLPLPTIALRLKPGQDIFIALEELAAQNNLDAAVLLSAVGSLKKAALRFANQEHSTIIEGPLEIVSATGTVSRHGLHIHLAVADSNGLTKGGHLTAGSSVYTTIELVVLDLSETYSFQRKHCSESGFVELQVVHYAKETTQVND